VIPIRLTWVIGGAVAALLAVAGVDALRSSDEETSPSATTVATITEGESSVAAAPCRPKQIAVSIDIRKPDWQNQPGYVGDAAWKQSRVATMVVRNVGPRACDLHEEWHFLITDRRGHFVGRWNSEGLVLVGRYAPGAEKAFSLPPMESATSLEHPAYRCDYPGHYVVLARVGAAAPARRDNLSASEITC
jgi:hypothetical protein